MTLQQADYEEVLRHLRDTREPMRWLMAVSRDWAAREVVEAEFRVLGVMIRDFAKYQLGVPIKGRPWDPRAG